MNPRWTSGLLCLLVVASGCHAARTQAVTPRNTGVCPTTCPGLPAQQRNAAALAVSMVAFIGCSGDLKGAARAIVAAASSGATEAFSAGLSVGAATITGADNAKGQMAEALTESFTLADSGQKAKAVASAVGSAMHAMAGDAKEAMMAEAITSFNDLAGGGQCALAASTAFEMYRSLRTSDKKAGAKFLALAMVNGKTCWTRRVLRLAASPVFTRPPPVSPCTGYMRNASAVSVSLISASACGLPSDGQLDAAAYALVTAAAKDGCSFSSAVTSVSLAGVADPKNIISIYTAAIPKARLAGSSGKLANAFTSAMAEVVGVSGDASGLLSDVTTAIAMTIQTSGCAAAAEFATGVYSRLAAQDPANAADVRAAFMKQPAIATCKFVWA
ncbi:MAG: hypothetical protein J3K34DRAFT_414296 [Monoraphidium minutum]|nr:MAG: hypothetical protein J3K34DRAFT_414296 [Monoraphidium minutum]